MMYDLVDRLDPDRYYALALATYAEMALAGITAVGEFHYLHHDVGDTATRVRRTPWARRCALRQLTPACESR